MKFIYHIALALTSFVGLASCEKDAAMVSVSSSATPTLTASQDSVVLLQANAADTAFTFNWSPVEVTWSNDNVSSKILSYALQIDTRARNFQGAPMTTIDTEATSGSMTVAALNAALLELKATPEEPIQLVARLAVILAPNNIQYSNVLDLQATPYADVVILPSLFIAGALNGWSHSTDYRVGSINSDSNYEGYFNFTAGNLAFKFSSQANWDGTNYGAGAAAGRLSADGGAGNLEVPAAGYYLLKADTEALTWTATPMTWGIIGEAAGGWDDANDVSMTYNAEARVWTATLDMTPGEFKFRANKAWAIGLGAGPRNGVLSYEGGNLRVAEAGRYLVTLDLSNAGYYTYTLEAQ